MFESRERGEGGLVGVHGRASGGTVCIGLDLGATKMSGGTVVVESGEILHSATVPTGPERVPEIILADTLEFASNCLTAAEASSRRVAGMGVAIAEIVDPDGAITSTETFRWSSLPVANALSQIAEPVRFESDVRAAGFAESRFGAGRGLRSFVYVTISSGISSCLVIDGRPLLGRHGAAQVFASAVTPEHCPVCGADYDFCLETHASGLGLARRYAAATSKKISRAEEVFSAAAEGDHTAADIINTAARAVGKAIAFTVNLLDPEAIIIGGSLGLAAGPYRDRLVEAARREIWHQPSRNVPIVSAELGGMAGMIGAAALAT
jgi:glucokinase